MDEMQNNLTELVMGIETGINQVSQADTARENLRYFMITNDRNLLAQLYIEVGLVQTLIDLPVDDGFRIFPDIICDQLSVEDIKKIEAFFEANGWYEDYKQSVKWGRLFGGAGLFINVAQNPESELRLDRLTQNSKIKMYPLDRWELNFEVSGDVSIQGLTQGVAASDAPYNIYGQQVHKSRVLRVVGKQAPSLQRMQLMGWGMSEVERLLRSLNSFLKNQDVVFELLDEAKVDVYKIFGYNKSLLTRQGTTNINKQIQMSNRLKSFLNALVLDSEDEYDQKNMSFSGLSDILMQIRQAVAADLRMPMTKLFGMSAAGFNSGEDDLENYNSMVESEIRAKNKSSLIMLIKGACQILFGFIPEDIDIEWPSLRVLSAEQDENVKNNKFNRLMQAYMSQLITDEQFADACTKENLLCGVSFDQVSGEFKQDEQTPEMQNNRGWLSWLKRKY